MPSHCQLKMSAEESMGTQVVLKEVQTAVSKKNLPSLLKRQFKSLSDEDGPCVRIFQWNILAQALSQGDDNFCLCPIEALDWDNRHLHILEELLTYNASVLCLQEVDRFSFLEEKLKSVGYKGVFFPKPYSPCLDCDISYGPDGCAVFWKTDELDLLDQENVVLQNLMGHATNQVSIICKFQTKKGGKQFYVAVTHLKAKNGFSDVRYEQGHFLNATLESMTGNHPVIVCGDFNAEQTEKVYEVFKTSKVGLVSSYAQLSGDGSEIPFTTWKVRGGITGKKELSRTIDYVWFTPSKIGLKSVLMMPTVHEIGENRLPSHTYPSDHLSLVCDFVLK
ncbi:nocturnin-like isoform X1 [Haliotis rufescens]|uniref:nocturnin-like isoform X1 n=2 Tax=Haliotis rufescens TaxID=6454 RepID=UPI001EB09FAF|nr:nocturnin-like isoform X1 [Haliotis rufescens]